MKIVSDASTLFELKQDIVKLARHQAAVYINQSLAVKGLQNKRYLDRASAMNDFAETLEKMEIQPR